MSEAKSKLLEEEQIWDYSLIQDEYMPQEFGLGIVGIGALFFAYSSVTADPLVKQIIALIGMAGSFVLWVHIWGSRKELTSIRDELRKTNSELLDRFDSARAWRTRGRYIVLYYPVTRLMGYFMALVMWSWIIILLKSYPTPLLSLSQWTVLFVGSVIVNAIYQRIQDVRHGAPLRPKTGDQTGKPASTNR